MDDILAKKNRHLFLEEKDNTHNSFISNINYAVENIDTIKTFNDNVNSGTMQHLLETYIEQVGTEGNAWVVKLTELGESILATTSGFNYAAVLTVTQDIEAGATITLPEAMKYRVGTHMLLVSWNGTVCYNDEQYEEVGAFNEKSAVIKIKQDIKTGDKLEFRTVALADIASVSLALGDAITSYTFPINSSNTERTLAERFLDIVNVKDFGAKGDAETDDTIAILAADAYAAQNGGTVFFPHGTYAITASIEKSAKWVGAGAPQLGTFPQLEDDKRFLKAGVTHSLPGSAILVKTGSYSSFTTTRSDLFSNFTYAVKTAKDHPSGMEGIAIVQDMDVFNGDALTSVNADNRTLNVDVGYLIDDAVRCEHRDFVVFGYWPKAGTVIWSGGSLDNPDYNKFFGGSTSGYYGLVLIGSDSADGPGLSGTQCYGFQIFANDHHSRETQSLQTYQDNGYGHCLFIDGKTPALVANADGAFFFGGGIRTYSNKPVQLKAASCVQFIGVTFELPNIGSSGGDGYGALFTATEQTFSVGFYGCRNVIPTLFNHSAFGDVIRKLVVQGVYDGGMLFGSKGHYININSATISEVEYTPIIDFTDNVSSIASGTRIYKNLSSGAVVTEKRADALGSTLTVSNGSITPVFGYHAILGEDAAADDLTTISGTFVAGQHLILRQGNQSQPITLKHSGGNIRFGDGVNRVLNHQQAQIELIYNGTYWTECSSNVFNKSFVPLADNSYNVGSTSFRIKQLYAGTATISTSDAREKEGTEIPPETLMRAWGKVNFKVFQFIDAIKEKGIEVARLHVGVIAQEVQEAFASEGLDASRYGLFCYDEWDAEMDADGNEISSAGNRYGIRYEEALALECAYQRWLGEQRDVKIEALMQRISALENNR